jgi:hypothetical protein
MEGESTVAFSLFFIVIFHSMTQQRGKRLKIPGGEESAITQHQPGRNPRHRTQQK